MMKREKSRKKEELKSWRRFLTYLGVLKYCKTAIHLSLSIFQCYIPSMYNNFQEYTSHKLRCKVRSEEIKNIAAKSLSTH